MMGILTSMADRVLSLVVPRASAGACCQNNPGWVFCYCNRRNPREPNLRYAKYCQYNCSCQQVCGPCQYVSAC